MTTHYITATDVVTGGFNDDAWLVLDGAPIATSLGFVAEDQPLPGLNGGLPGEKWDNFDSFGINEAGEYFWTATPTASAPAPTSTCRATARSSTARGTSSTARP